MTQVTDEMVTAAQMIINDPRMRAALEAALVVYMVERAELIEALRQVANIPIIEDGPSGEIVPRLHDKKIISRARDLLERLGAVPGHGWHDLSKHPERDL